MTNSDSPENMRFQLLGETETLIQEYLDGTLRESRFLELQQLLREDPTARRRYFEVIKMTTLLREEALKSGEAAKSVSYPGKKTGWSVIALAGAACLLVLVSLSWVFRSVEPKVGVRLVAASDVRWLSEQVDTGEELSIGSEIRLASGKIELKFPSGASTVIHGPASFSIESGNGGYLRYGKVHSVADGEEALGFTLRTASSTYVDRGTEFLTVAMADGYSQMFVIEGAVDASAQGFDRRRISNGSGIGFELGEDPVMIQIENGAGTPAFEFPTIPPPSNEDFASTHPVSFEVDVRELRDAEKGVVAPHSAPVEVLVNGQAQRDPDDPEESFFLRGDSAGYIVIDLGSPVSITGIHTYSWHLNQSKPERTLRAVQRYHLWAAKVPRPSSYPTADSPAGWTRVASAPKSLN